MAAKKAAPRRRTRGATKSASKPARRTRRAPGALTPKQERFVAEYLVDLNATQAAIRAGYSPKTAVKQGHRLLTNADISRAVEAGRTAVAERVGITAERVLAELEQLAFSNVEHYVIDDADNIKLAEGAPAAAIRAVASIKRRTIPQRDGADPIREVEFRLWDKPGQLKLAGQHVGLFTKKVELTGKDGGPIVTKQEAFDITNLSDEDLAHLQRIVGLPKTA